MSTVAIMPKPKPKPTKQKSTTAPSGGRRVVLQMKGTEEWKAWLDGLAKQLRMPTSAIVDNALVEYAKARGYDQEAPGR